MLSKHDIIPVVMFHSLGMEKSNWIFSYISEPLATFEQKICALVKSGYHFIFWNDLYDHMSGTKRAPNKSIMLTFDDGYLDNWVYLFPILKKYQAKATIFVNPEFVDLSDEVRSNLEDVWIYKVSYNKLFLHGFLNWEEMRLMEKSGLVDIQSHSLTHTWFFSGPRLLDFHKPGNRQYPWLAWNARPGQKPYYINNDQESFVPWGTPIYEHEKALICRRYFPPEELTKKITDLVKQKAGKDFFLKKGCEMDLREYHHNLMNKYKENGFFESSDEYKNRVFFELSESKRTIEKQLNKKVDFICWPGGGYDSIVLALAKKAGYKAWTLSSRNQSGFRNRPDSDINQIKRISSFSRYRMNGKEYGYAGVYYFMCGIARHKGSLLKKWIGRILLILKVGKSKLLGRKHGLCIVYY